MKKKVGIVTLIILLVAVIIAISFFGIYVKNENGEKRNIIPNYKMGMEFTNVRQIVAKVSDGVASQRIYDQEGNEITEKQEDVEYTEENGYRIEETKINPEETRTLDNFKKSKEVLETKLKNLRTPEYAIMQNEENGQITIKIPENNLTETTETAIKTPGTLIFFDTTNFSTVFDNSYIETSQVVTRQGDLEMAVFLQIKLTNEGITKLQELKDTYKETTEIVTNEDGTTEEKAVKKEVFVILNGMSIGTTVVENIVYDNTIMIPFIVSNNNAELNTAIEEARTESIILNAGLTPLTYNYTDETIPTDLKIETVLTYIAIIGAVFVILFVFLIIKFKAKGFISMYFQIGFFAVLLLIVRLTNVTLTMEGMAGLILAVLINYIFNYIMLKHMDEVSMYKEANLSFLFHTLPVFILAILFTFSTKANLASFGMTIFWGIIITYVYNFIFSKYVFENLTGGKDESSKNNN